MTQHPAQHAAFTIERSFDAPPALVFRAFADPAAKAKWFGGPNEWDKHRGAFEFRVGGRESISGGPKGGTQHKFDAVYQDIVPNARIVYSYSLELDDRRISVSLATIEFVASDKGTKLTLTEQGVFLDGYDDAGSREAGTRGLLEKLAAAVTEMASA
ncbi:MAG TPA: SRPBCC family protein [Alphaproteobacteria bacterium]|jgi:uncharacterized protein YndB with AHSA1/START domain|nr:SRPBCC family protein [Alphaproteobacteria bacterium]